MYFVIKEIIRDFIIWQGKRSLAKRQAEVQRHLGLVEHSDSVS